MNRLAKHSLIRATALAAALAFGFAPASLLADCACDQCGCAAAGTEANCCCTGASTLASCCFPADQQACAIGSPGCSCEVGVPAPPAVVAVSSDEARSKESGGGIVEPIALPFLTSNHASSAPAGLPSAAQDRGADSAIPFRVLFCVWRN
jgi:hypothetical protein